MRFYRESISEVVKRESIKYNLSITEFYEIISKFNAVVDRAIYSLSFTYSSKYSTRLYAAESIALELSVPIIRITEEIGVFQLVGNIDTNRASELIYKALFSGTNYVHTYLVIDLSGVPIVDTMVANQIFQVLKH